jgi:hypothetical protein
MFMVRPCQLLEAYFGWNLDGVWEYCRSVLWCKSGQSASDHLPRKLVVYRFYVKCQLLGPVYPRGKEMAVGYILKLVPATTRSND